MVIIINPIAGGGKALKKWKKIESAILNRSGPVKVIILDEKLPMEDCVPYLLEQDYQHFIAGGGDGTVNLLLQSLMNYATPDQLIKIKIGAIGLGSSNDFHKPLNTQHRINGIPCKVNFSHARARDIGLLTFGNKSGMEQKKYWLINASIGITAEANLFFNTPDFILDYLKKTITNGAILYTALRTIATYRNRNISIKIGTNRAQIINLTNMGIVKSPHFSGNFSYDTPFETDNGLFYINICQDMHRLNTLYLLWNLSKSKFSGLSKTESICSDQLEVKSNKRFAVEYDGEVIATNKAVFNIKPKMIKVCTC